MTHYFKYQKAYRARLFSRGLTCAGKPRKQHRHNLPRAITPEQHLANSNARMKYYTALKNARGLSQRGKPLKVALPYAELLRRNRVRNHNRRQNFLMLGLTTAGKPRKNAPMRYAWRVFRRSLNLPESRSWTDAVAFIQRSEAA